MFDFNLSDFIFIEEIFKKEVTEDFKLRKKFNKVEGVSWETEGEIMIRVNEDRLTIARINVLNTRKGILTSILNKLITYCKETNKNKIIIESAFTESMINFALKNGFKPDKYNIHNMNGLDVGNYELDL